MKANFSHLRYLALISDSKISIKISIFVTLPSLILAGAAEPLERWRLFEDGNLFDGGSYIFATWSNKDKNFDTYVTIRN